LTNDAFKGAVLFENRAFFCNWYGISLKIIPIRYYPKWKGGICKEIEVDCAKYSLHRLLVYNPSG